MLMRLDGSSVQAEIDYTRQHAILVHQLIVDKVPILDIYQFGGN